MLWKYMTPTERTAAWVLLLAMLAGMLGCTPPAGPTVVVCGGVGACGGTGGGASPSPSPSPSGLPCVPVALVTVGLSGGGGRTTIQLGVEEVLDVTPRDASGGEVPASCHGTTVMWAISGTAVCTLTGQLTGFNPHVRCTTAGTLVATATVSAPGGTGAAAFTVQ